MLLICLCGSITTACTDPADEILENVPDPDDEPGGGGPDKKP